MANGCPWVGQTTKGDGLSTYNNGMPAYQPADDSYLAQRKLRRHARVLHLWAMGVGAVISGDFFGWNFGLAAGGFGGMMLAVAAMTALYLGLSVRSPKCRRHCRMRAEHIRSRARRWASGRDTSRGSPRIWSTS